MAYDPTDIADQDGDREAALDRARILNRIEVDDFKWIMGNKRGRRFIWRLLEQAGVFRSSFSTNSMQTSFNEGNRNFGLRVLAMVHEHTPALFVTMLDEQRDKHDRSSNGSSGSPNHN